MRVLGISVDPAGGKPRIVGAVVSGTAASPSLETEFELRAADTDPTEQVVDLGRLLLAKLPGLAFDKAVVRTAGARPVPTRNKAQFSRAHAEGAAMYVVREHLGKPVECGDPRSFAKTLAMDKDALVATAKRLSARKHEAVIAALSGLPAS